MKSRFVSLAALALIALLTFATTANASVVFKGSGWGHGVGLSQYGAKAMGLDGASYEQILKRYFTNIAISELNETESSSFIITDESPLSVGILQNSSTVLFVVQDGKAQLCFNQGSYCVGTANSGETFRFGAEEIGKCAFLRINDDKSVTKIGTSGSCSASVIPNSKETKLFIPYKARSYKSGILKFRQKSDSMRINTVYELGVEDYLKGLSEVPDSWPLASIQAQVIVSRSYAVWKALERGEEGTLSFERQQECSCNLRDDKSDQVFLGWTGEAAHPRWVEAVTSTSGQILSINGQTALGLYSSSSGGMTENYSDVFEGGDHPHLVTVNDFPAFSIAASNPHSSWEANYSQELISNIFGFDRISNIFVTERNESGSAKNVRIRGVINGQSASMDKTALEIKESLGLRSTTFEIVSSTTFEDVPTEHIFAREIMILDESGITSGCEVDRFCPDRAVTRAEMAAFLTRALGLDLVDDEKKFQDDDGHFLESQIATLAANGITSGCEVDRFCPDRAVTRAEMAAFLTRALKL
tara:strand:+ start:1237 stop:2826 length:1590 start_codon:yes stop_codon:yes gene_type:complete